MEFAIGHKYKGSSPLSLARLSPKAEWLGWWQVAISFFISVYYSVIIAWAMSYFIFSFKLSWGKDTEAFLYGDYLKLAEAPGQTGSIVLHVLIPLVLVWIVTLGVLLKGIKKELKYKQNLFTNTNCSIFNHRHSGSNIRRSNGRSARFL